MFCLVSDQTGASHKIQVKNTQTCIYINPISQKNPETFALKKIKNLFFNMPSLMAPHKSLKVTFQAHIIWNVWNLLTCLRSLLSVSLQTTASKGRNLYSVENTGHHNLDLNDLYSGAIASHVFYCCGFYTYRNRFGFYDEKAVLWHRLDSPTCCFNRF